VEQGTEDVRQDRLGKRLDGEQGRREKGSDERFVTASVLNPDCEECVCAEALC